MTDDLVISSDEDDRTGLGGVGGWVSPLGFPAMFLFGKSFGGSKGSQKGKVMEDDVTSANSTSHLSS